MSLIYSIGKSLVYPETKKRLRYLVALLFFVLFHFSAQAQYFQPVWVNDIGGTGDSKATNIAVDGVGDIYISGYIRGTETFNLKEGGSKTLTSNGDADVYIAKYSIATGNYIWAISFGGIGTDLTNSMTIDSQGNVILTGQFQSSVNFNPQGNFVLTSNGSDDIFIAKYTAAGNFVWATGMGGQDIDRGHYITVDSNDNIFMSGSYTGAININTKGTAFYLPNQNTLALFFAKYDPNGNLVWAHALGNVAQTNLSAVAIDKTTQDLVITGDFSGTVDFSYTGIASATFVSPAISNLVARYTNAGVYEWVDCLTGSGSGIMSSLHISPNSDIVITGSFGGQIYPSGQGGSSITALGPADLLVASYKSTGGLNWANHYGSSTGSVNTRYITGDINNNVYVTGFFSGTVNISQSLSNGVLTDANGGYSVYLAGFNSSGTPIAAGAIGSGCTGNTGYEMAAVNGNVYVAGSFCQTANFNTGGCNPDNLTAINSISDSYLASFVIANSPVGSISAFSIPQEISPAVINQTNHTIAVEVAPGSNIKSLTPTATFTSNTTLSPASGTAEDFSSPVTYTVSSSCSAVPYTVTVTVAAAQVLTTCSGATNTITGDTETPVPDSYLWQVFQNNAWDTAPGTVNGQNYQATFTNTTNASVVYQLRRQISVGTTTSYDSFFNITVLAAIANNTVTAPAVTTFCSGGTPAVITGSIPSGGNGTYSFQWQSSTDNTTFTNIAGATAQNYTPAALTSTAYFLRTVTSGTCTTPLLSNVVQITITPTVAGNTITAPAITGFCAGGTPAAIAGSLPTGGDGAYAYQWQSSTDNITFTNIAGATAQDYTPPALTATTYFLRTVTSGVCTTPLLSNVVQITITPLVAGNTITAPAVTSFCASGTPAALTGSIPTGGNGTYTYQWQTSTDNISFTTITGATGQNYTPGVLAATTYFERTVISGVCTTPLVSNAVEIIVVPLITNNIINAPAVTSFCSSGVVGTITGGLPAGGDGSYVYQWQRSTDNVNFTNISGAAAQDYSPPAITTTTYFQRTVVSGICNVPLASNLVTIQITSPPATPVPAAATTSVCQESTATLSVSSPLESLTYNWYDSPSKTNLLFTGPSYVTGVINAMTTFYVEAVNGSCSSPSLASVQVNVSAAPTVPAVVNAQVAVCNGSTVILNISNPQSDYTYNWYTEAAGGSSVFTGTAFTTPALSTGVTYYAEAVNGTGCLSATRTPVVITINVAPGIAATAASVCPGTAATLTATSTDDNAVINWYTAQTGGSSIFTGSSFTTPSLNSTTTYYAEAGDNANACMSSSRVAAIATVLQQLATPVVTVSSTTTSSVTFEWAAVTGATGYQVSIDNGATFTTPSSGSDGLTTTIPGLQEQQSVTIIVQALGQETCEQSSSSTAVTGVAATPSNNIIYVPNLFTPNGDGINDQVHVHSESIKSLKFYIYDQWGELLFSSTDQQKGWDGTYKGTRQPAGVYVYYLQAVMDDGQTMNKKGTITLLR